MVLGDRIIGQFSIFKEGCIMITKLTPQQEVDKIEFLKRYTEIGLNNNPTDKSCVEEINLFYKELGEKEPHYIWVEGPDDALITISALSTELPKDLADWSDREIDSGETLSRDLINAYAKATKTQYFSAIFGNGNAYWVLYLKFGEHIGVKYDEANLRLLNIWDSLIRKCGWFYPFKNLCVVCDRPQVCLFDDNRELHCDNGPAIEFASGFKMYSLHGVEVPEFVVMNPESITMDHIEKEGNAEIRRIMIDRMGVSKYLEECKAELVDGDMTFVANQNDDRYVPRALMKDKEGRKFLVGTDGSTSRVYYMQVPEECNTCAEAASNLAGFDEKKIIATS